MPAAAEALERTRFTRRRLGSAACGATLKCSLCRVPSQRPCSTQLTGKRRREPAGHQHGGVEGAVLLGAEHLLALEDEQRQVGRVLDQEVADRRALVELLDERAELGGLGEGAVGQPRLGPDDGKDGERRHVLRRAEGEGDVVSVCMTE